MLPLTSYSRSLCSSSLSLVYCLRSACPIWSLSCPVSSSRSINPASFLRILASMTIHLFGVLMCAGTQKYSNTETTPSKFSSHKHKCEALLSLLHPLSHAWPRVGAGATPFPDGLGGDSSVSDTVMFRNKTSYRNTYKPNQTDDWMVEVCWCLCSTWRKRGLALTMWADFQTFNWWSKGTVLPYSFSSTLFFHSLQLPY